MAASNPTTLVDAALSGDRRSLARLVSWVEDDAPGAAAALAKLFPRTGRAHTIGLTGAPGAGKSTLTNALIERVRAGGSEVAVVAVDPSSPYTGGAVLGDRIRMQDHIADGGVYIRSLASRGHLGGISAATPKVLSLLDAVGFPVVLVETVGVGQAEVDIAGKADTTVVVVNPGWGDTIQAAKAGLLEIGDIFVVNKADRPGVDATVRDLEQMLDLGTPGSWRPPVLTTVAAEGTGVDDVWEEAVRHRVTLEASGELEALRTRRLEDELAEALAMEAQRRAGAAGDEPGYRAVAADVTARRMDPWSAATLLLDAS